MTITYMTQSEFALDLPPGLTEREVIEQVNAAFASAGFRESVEWQIKDYEYAPDPFIWKERSTWPDELVHERHGPDGVRDRIQQFNGLPEWRVTVYITPEMHIVLEKIESVAEAKSAADRIRARWGQP